MPMRNMVIYYLLNLALYIQPHQNITYISIVKLLYMLFYSFQSEEVPNTVKSLFPEVYYVIHTTTKSLN